MPTALVTGSSGFIGFFVSQLLLAEGWNVVGIDSMNDYYDVSLKEKRPENGKVPAGDSLSPVAPYRVVNIGNNDSIQLMEFIEAIEDATGKEAQKNFMEIQAGDVPATWADANLLQSLTGYTPKTKVREGVAEFVKWYRDFYDA